LVEIIASIGVGLALLYVYAANLSAGRFFGLISGIFIIYEPIKTLSKPHIVMQRSLGATTQIFSILDSVPAVQDAPNAVELVSSQGRIDFEDVTFRYSTGVTDAVRAINLHIEPGKTYALVGASGAGKSTILSLILRLYDPTSGSVKIDGHNLRALTQKSLRAHFSRMRRSYCSMKRHRRSTPNRKNKSRRRSRNSQPGAPSSRLRTGSPRFCRPTKSSCSIVAILKKSAAMPSSSKNPATIVAFTICNLISQPKRLQKLHPSPTCSLKNLSNFPPARI